MRLTTNCLETELLSLDMAGERYPRLGTVDVVSRSRRRLADMHTDTAFRE